MPLPLPVDSIEGSVNVNDSGSVDVSGRLDVTGSLTVDVIESLDPDRILS
ncbi:MAG: hypothetical protein ABSF90_27800 [Syntrophobacteraceae bacterium]